MSETKIKTKVILVGASGNLGPSVLNAFLAAPDDFDVSVLTRPDSTATFPPNTNVVKSDYKDESLKAAFTGKDAVVSLLGNAGFGELQNKVVDAAIEAGVKRFVPSEFGSDTPNPAVRAIVPVFNSKRGTVEHIQKKQSEGAKNISWTGLITGPFFDWGLEIGFLGFDPKNRKATLWDNGTARFATSNLNFIGRALVRALHPSNFEKTENQYVHVASFVTTQKEVLAAFERATGQKWTVEHKSTEVEQARATEKFAKNDFSEVATLILAATYGPAELGAFERLWNEDLGLEKESLDETVKAVLEGRRP
ncbi:uncharacterized protein K452DRAFT_292286 [Aplosporella prunicola CBS 121167]|uniref:NmrA-like domain-containing protein n=1 Tax=Aplosporella prunicola CBS 121167 TaxID=1176127 RepID=A0A6A6B018_9PEZI|nr:uncharacterized protein K452DRAFT_292286 [Aplosporella prunicola CBS 121167]KAF2136565.1 hypothetical protein K452DRAFT_292286 [Aplosporella prunicola CBS 121167]